MDRRGMQQWHAPSAIDMSFYGLSLLDSLMAKHFYRNKIKSESTAKYGSTNSDMSVSYACAAKLLQRTCKTISMKNPFKRQKKNG